MSPSREILRSKTCERGVVDVWEGEVLWEARPGRQAGHRTKLNPSARFTSTLCEGLFDSFLAVELKQGNISPATTPTESGNNDETDSDEDSDKRSSTAGDNCRSEIHNLRAPEKSSNMSSFEPVVSYLDLFSHT